MLVESFDFNMININEIIENIKNIDSLEELNNFKKIDSNALIYAINQANKYDLFKENTIRLNLNNKKTLEKLLDFFLKDEDTLYYMLKNGFNFTKEELNILFIMTLDKYQNTYKLDCFFRYFFLNSDDLNNFVREHESFFIDYLEKNSDDIFGSLRSSDAFVKLILNGNYIKLIDHIEDYSLTNMKLLVNILKRKVNLIYYLGNYNFANKLFTYKEAFTYEEFYYLISLLVERNCYDKIDRKTNTSLFTNLISTNIDYLIEMVDKIKMPKCLVESETFRDLCIKKNRIDLAVKCILPINIIENEQLVQAYSKELNIETKTFYERFKEVLKYQEKNENIFNTILTTSLRDEIFSIKGEHLERFINDISIQIAIDKLNNQELLGLKRILEKYNYQDYDITPMISNIIKNIHTYQELVANINFPAMSWEMLEKLIKVIEVPNNPYHIIDISDLDNYASIKEQYFLNNSKSLEDYQNNLLMWLLNINLEEAKYIDSKYCHDNSNKNILEELKNSELPSDVYSYLELINRIVNLKDIKEVKDFYYDNKDKNSYNFVIPLESYLRAKYTEIYAKSLYQIKDREDVYGPKDCILKTLNYQGKSVKVCVPRASFRFLIHCVDSYTKSKDVSYYDDWVNRPQLQDHLVACSYINEKGIFSSINRGTIILGFANLDNGAILAMGNTDIDSIGSYAKAYDSSKELQNGNGARARYFVPSQLLKTINEGYNEIVIERRNLKKTNNFQMKKEPDYIIMMTDSLRQDSIDYLNNVFNRYLPFVSLEDRKLISNVCDKNEIKNILDKYIDDINVFATNNNFSFDEIMTLLIAKILKAQYFENSLKVAADFDIPLVIIDKEYYFKKALQEATVYDEETKKKIWQYYKASSAINKKNIFNRVAVGNDVTNMLASMKSWEIIPRTIK